MLEKTPECLLDSKEIKPVIIKGDQPRISTGRNDDEAEAPVFWSSDVNRWLIGKVPAAGKDWGQKRRMSEDEMAGRHLWCNEHELGQTPGGGEGQGGLHAAVHEATKSWTPLGDWTTLCGTVQSFNTIIYSIILKLFILYLFPVDGELFMEKFMSNPSFVFCVSYGNAT